MTKYYNILKGLWQELDIFYGFEWVCAADGVCFKKMREKEQVFELLVRLNKELDEVCGQILGKESLPSIQ